MPGVTMLTKPWCRQVLLPYFNMRGIVPVTGAAAQLQPGWTKCQLSPKACRGIDAAKHEGQQKFTQEGQGCKCADDQYTDRQLVCMTVTTTVSMIDSEHGVVSSGFRAVPPETPPSTSNRFAILPHSMLRKSPTLRMAPAPDRHTTIFWP